MAEEQIALKVHISPLPGFSEDSISYDSTTITSISKHKTYMSCKALVRGSGFNNIDINSIQPYIANKTSFVITQVRNVNIVNDKRIEILLDLSPQNKSGCGCGGCVSLTILPLTATIKLTSKLIDKLVELINK